MEHEINKLAKRESIGYTLGWIITGIFVVGILYAYKTRKKDE